MHTLTNNYVKESYSQHSLVRILLVLHLIAMVKPPIDKGHSLEEGKHDLQKVRYEC